MNKLISLFGVILLTFTTGSVVAQESDYVEGKHYVRIDPVVPPLASDEAKHEVVELFWYGCSHCYDFEPHIKKWKEGKAEDVTFVRVPAIFNPRGNNMLAPITP